MTFDLAGVRAIHAQAIIILA